MHFPVAFFFAGALLTALLVETWFKRRHSWAMPAVMLYLTIFAWYFVDLFITPENYEFIPDELLEISYWQVILFLIAYRLAVPIISRRISVNAERFLRDQKPVKAETIFVGAIGLWLSLLTCGVMQLNGDLFAALFPMDARAGITMWQRAAGGDAGPSGFLISIGGYLYVLVCASFGMLFVFLRSLAARVLAVVLVLISWPFFVLSGTRSAVLAVCVPLFLAYWFFGRQRRLIRLAVLSVAFLVLNSLLLIVISYRGVGFQEYLSGDQADKPDEADIRHEGLNMIQELCFVNVYDSINGPDYGIRYLGELANVIPRAVWPNKPLIGIDYAIFRGFGGGDSDIGVVATISTGLIGGGILNFGPIFGPLAPAILMACYTGLLVRWWRQRASLLRCMLFLAGLGLTFNLGRDITLLVLWPIVFGYVLVRVVEYFSKRPAPQLSPVQASPSHPHNPPASQRPPVGTLSSHS